MVSSLALPYRLEGEETRNDQSGQEWPLQVLFQGPVTDFQELFIPLSGQHCLVLLPLLRTRCASLPHAGHSSQELGLSSEIQDLNPSESSPLSVLTNTEQLGRDSGLDAFLNELRETKLTPETRVSFGRVYRKCVPSSNQKGGDLGESTEDELSKNRANRATGQRMRC